jgi:hypothetical protein
MTSDCLIVFSQNLRIFNVVKYRCNHEIAGLETKRVFKGDKFEGLILTL